MTVTKNATGGWDVMSHGAGLLASFGTNAEAWRYVDRCGGEPISKSEQRSEFVWQMATGDGR
jgi:hypothetical protein